jgi:hypothetical protein
MILLPNSAFNSSLTSFFISFFISLFNLLTLSFESFSSFDFFSLSIEAISEKEISLDISFFFVVYDTDLLSSSLFRADFLFLLLSRLSLFICLNNSNFSSGVNFFFVLRLEKDAELILLSSDIFSISFFSSFFFTSFFSFFENFE